MKYPQNIILILLIGTSIIFSCKKNIDEVNEKIDKQELLKLVNNVRKSGCKCGNDNMPPVPPITWSNELQKVAQAHTEDMFENKKLSHKGSNGSDPGKRLEDAGYNWSTYGENIAEGYTSEEEVIEGWKKSNGHCKNIMKKEVTEMGVGRVGNYWTQIFALKK